ncbi:HEAT repeat-containing protein 6 [Homalodisca vitripennis]|nr:HEAT repeat-containing protein 6 [Homalodisca vitripennis]
MADEIVATLCVQLEAKASLTTPQDVRVWRVQCLKAIAPAVKPSCRPKFISSLWQLLQQSPSMNCDADAQVVKFVLEALETICESDVEWLTENLGDVLGVVVAFLQFGLHGWQYQKPSKLLPLPGVQWDPPPAPNIKRVQASSNCDLQIASISKETPAIVTPEIIHPLPKAASRKKTRKGKRQGKMRILTNTGRE